MRVNVYAEEMTSRVEMIAKEIDGQTFTGIRFYLELPATQELTDANGKHLGYQQHQGPFMHRPGDDDSSAVTFWGKRDFRDVLRKALALLDERYGKHDQKTGVDLIAAERRRQIEDEGFDAMHDREMNDAGNLAAAGGCYAIEAGERLNPALKDLPSHVPLTRWPWTREWWKPKNPVRDLIRAGALIAAEIDRLLATTKQESAK